MTHMAAKLEVERKYELPDGFVLPDFPNIQEVGEPEVHDLDAVYYDTEALHLARGRVTLRRRSGGNDAGWHLKRPSGGERSELQVPGDSRQTKPPAAVTGQVRALSRGEALRPVARIRTRRIERALRAADGSTVALVADDEVRTESLLGDRTARQWHELEVELVDGAPEDLAGLDAALRAAGARPAKSPSKLAQALGDDYPPADTTTPAGSKARRALAAYVAAQRDAMVANDPGVRDGDPEAVHRMRVATRRLRSTLKTFERFLGEQDRLHEEVKWVTGLLGEVRDTDVMGERLAALLDDEPAELVLGPVRARITSMLAAKAARARTALLAGLDSARYTTLLNDLDALVAATAAPGRIKRRDLLRQAHKSLRRAEDRLDNAADDEERHESRKAFKRARYAAELAEPLAGPRATRLADALTALQDVLGAHQDAIVTGELLKHIAIAAHAAGENAFTFGLLHARADEHGRRALDDLKPVRRKARRAGRTMYS
jgi:CHAD domain-containing protein